MDVVLWNDCPHPKAGFMHRTLGPYKLASYIKKHGYDVQVIDFTTAFNEELLYNATKHFITDNTLVLGISMTFIAQHQWQHDDGVTDRIPLHFIKVIGRLKIEFPKLKIILGGYLGDKVSGWGVVDASVSSYAEDTFLELLEHYRVGSPPPKSQKILTRFGSNVMLNYTAPNLIRYDIERDNHNFSDNDLIFEDETLPIEISRGCMFKCKFCQFELLGRGKLDYLRSMECVKQEMLYNFSKFKTTKYMVVCDTFNDTEYKINEWHKMTTSLPFKIEFAAYIRADLIHRFPDTGYQLKESGMISAMHGIESLDINASHLVGKAWSGKHAKDFIPELYHTIWNKEVAQHINIIVGLPGDNKEKLNNTINWFIDNKLHSIRFDPLGMKQNPWTAVSEFEKNASKYGFSWDNDNWKNIDWNEKEAIQCAEDLNKQVWPYLKHHTWSILHLMGMDYKKEEIFDTLRNDFDWNDLWLRRRNKLKIYYNKLINL